MSESGEVLKEALQTARSEADILNALARRVEFVDGGRRRAGNPDRRGPGRVSADGPGDGRRKEAGELLKQLPWPRMVIDGHLVKDGDLARTAWWDPTTAADGRQVLMCIAVFDWQPSDDVARFEYWDRCEHPVVLKVERVHELWRDADPQPRHPLAPLVRACRI